MIELKNVSFSYEKDRPVIRDLSFKIADGESVGLIGANGAGKSTVMKLILGLCSGQGRVLIDGASWALYCRTPTTRCSCLQCTRT